MSYLLKHLKTIRTHRRYVRRMCFKMGIGWQGIIHDLSKYSIPELRMCKYWTGKGSPHQKCREVIGYSPSWIHHYHRNKHHFQYWWDEDEEGKIIPIKMPYKYAIESFCDMVGASKAYAAGAGKKWKPDMVLDYWFSKCRGKRIMNRNSMELLEFLLTMLKVLGEEEFVEWYKKKKEVLKEEYEQNHNVLV